MVDAEEEGNGLLSHTVVGSPRRRHRQWSVWIVELSGMML